MSGAWIGVVVLVTILLVILMGYSVILAFWAWIGRKTDEHERRSSAPTKAWAKRDRKAA